MTTNRPPRPAAYSLPAFIELKPVKHKMQKPYWSLKTDRVGIATANTKADIYKMLEWRMAKATMDDDQLYADLYNRCGGVLVNPWAYYIHRDGTYTAKDDKHEWHNADEVEMLKYLAAQRREARAA